MQRDTLLERTHQWWKLRVAVLGVVIALILQFVPALGLEGPNDPHLIYYTAVSVLLAAASLVVLFWGIRCPYCGAKWTQLATRQPGGRWLQWLRDLRVCPTCGSNGSRPPDNRRRRP